MTNLQGLALIHGMQRRVLTINHQLDLLTIQQEETQGMKQLDPIVAQALKELDDNTTAVGTRLQGFIDRANSAGTMTAQEIADALAPEIARLKVMGTDPGAGTTATGDPGTTVNTGGDTPVPIPGE